MSNDPSEKSSGYGNIYTPHAGSMIIHVQRESGLANRTIILTQRQVTLLRRGFYALATLVAIGAASWFYLATQAARVPFLTRRVATLQRDASRIDTLQSALTTLEGRFQQVQKMLGATAAPTAPATAATPNVPDAATPTKPPRTDTSPATASPPSTPHARTPAAAEPASPSRSGATPPAPDSATAAVRDSTIPLAPSRVPPEP